MGHFTAFEDISEVIAKGDTKSTVRLRCGLQVDLRSVAHASYGAALHYFTGSKPHNIRIRKRGVERNLKINEYGVFAGKKKVGGKKEKEIYDKVGLPYIVPELREDRGEVQAAEKDRLPKLIKLEDIKGDLHVHTRRTDGHQTIEEMAEAAKERGYDYIAITEHSKHVSVAQGLNSDELREHVEDIKKADHKVKGISILSGIEVDILEDGSLDLPDDVLSKLDVVICSIHYKFNLSEKKQTQRVIKAMDNPNFMILAHPTGRKINERKPYAIDLEEILKSAKEKGCFLELNAFPNRLDLADVACQRAREIGVKLAINTDAHRITHLDYIRYGIDQARRGWLEPADVINTRSVKSLKKLLKRS